eukprot:16347736-Heterocapsa_arctica.AAC.1
MISKLVPMRTLNKHVVRRRTGGGLMALPQVMPFDVCTTHSGNAILGRSQTPLGVAVSSFSV